MQQSDIFCFLQLIRPVNAREGYAGYEGVKIIVEIVLADVSQGSFAGPVPALWFCRHLYGPRLS